MLHYRVHCSQAHFPLGPVVFLCIGPGPSSAKRTWPHGTYRPFWAMFHGIPGFLSDKGKSRPSNKKQDGILIPSTTECALIQRLGLYIDELK